MYDNVRKPESDWYEAGYTAPRTDTAGTGCYDSYWSPSQAAASEYYDLPEGLYISAVAEGSDAEKQGIQSGDMLLAVNGQAVTTTYDVSAVKDGLKVGDTVTLTIYRDGKTFDVDVKLVDTNDIS